MPSQTISSELNRITAFIRKYCAGYTVPEPEVKFGVWPNGRFYGYDSLTMLYAESLDEALATALKQPINKRRELIITEDVRYVRYTFNEAGEPVQHYQQN